MPSEESASREYGNRADMRRVRARERATRLVSIVIHRRPHCSATYAVVPEPHVGSSTKSPGSVVIRRQRSTAFGAVWTTYTFESERLWMPPISDQTFVIG